MAFKDLDIDTLLQQYSPSRLALLEWLKPRIDSSMLWEIAQADYGYNAHKNLAALRQIHKDLQIAFPMEFMTKEVLELTHWSGPHDPDWRVGSSEERSHVRRLFACAILLMAGENTDARASINQENSILIQFVDSALSLGAEAAQRALRFLCWCLSNTMPEAEFIYEEYPFFVMAILLLRTALFKAGEDATDLSQLAEWVIQEEARVRNSKMSTPKSNLWLLGLTIFDQKHELWRTITLSVLLDSGNRIPEPAASALLGIAERVFPGGSMA